MSLNTLMFFSAPAVRRLRRCLFPIFFPFFIPMPPPFGEQKHSLAHFITAHIILPIMKMKTAPTASSPSFYDFEVKTPDDKTLQMKEFEGKAVLVVNTATKCGLAPQFDGLETLHQKYKDSGLVVLGFPCNQFMGQEPESNDTVEETCRINHGVTFQLTEKVKVNGPGTHPVFKYLKSELGGTFGDRLKWNFTKFLVRPNGEPYKRYAPITKPEDIEKDIKRVLKLRD